MKRSILFLILVFFTLVYGNPIWQGLIISEIYFDDYDHWFIEIDNKNFTNVHLEYVDSVKICCSTGSSIVRRLDTTDYILITSARLKSPLTIDRQHDYVSLYSFNGNSVFRDSLTFGDTTGSYLNHINGETSIARCLDNWKFYKDDSPTLQAINNLDDATAFMYGHFYYQDGQPITNRYFYISESNSGRIQIDEEGFYQVEIYCRTYEFDQIGLWNYAGFIDVMPFQSFALELEPDDSIEVNFYSTRTGITPVIKNDMVTFNNYPQPASNYSWFFIDNTDVEASAMRVNVYALNGRKIDSFIPLARQFRYDCSDLPQGSYIMTLQHGHEVLATKKLQILK